MMKGFSYMVMIIVLLACAIYPGSGLQCFSCTASGNTSSLSCAGVPKNCTAQDKQCNTYFVRKGNYSYEFTRDCVPAEVCAPSYCKSFILPLGYMECVVKCCEDSLCNKDVIINSNSPSMATFIAQWLVLLVTAIHVLFL